MAFDTEVDLELDETAVDKTVTIDVNGMDGYIVAYFINDPEGFAKSLETAPEVVREGAARSITVFYASLVEALFEAGAVKPIVSE